MPGLSDSQRRIVEYERLDRHMLVIAPPGSGKTHTISQRIAWLLNSGHAEPEQILALTYTNKAGRELKDRIAEDGRIRTCRRRLCIAGPSISCDGTAAKSVIPEWISGL